VFEESTSGSRGGRRQGREDKTGKGDVEMVQNRDEKSSVTIVSSS
jgi:hypothetical protein